MSKNKILDHSSSDEFDLKGAISSLLNQKWLIIAITFIFSILALTYASSLKPSYLVSTSFISPNKISVNNLNHYTLNSADQFSVFKTFLELIESTNIHSKVLEKNSSLIKESLIGKSKNDLITITRAYTANLTLIPPNNYTCELEICKEDNYEIQMRGSNPNDLILFMNNLILETNQENISSIISNSKSEVQEKIEDLKRKKRQVIEILEMERKSNIIKIQEADSVKIRTINGEIERSKIETESKRKNNIIKIQEADSEKIRTINGEIERSKTETESIRKSKMQIFIDNAHIAKKMDKLENNFIVQQLDNKLGVIFDVPSALSQLPIWYIYGEKALLSEIEMLKLRVNDGDYNPELIKLKRELSRLKNNEELKTLQDRKDDFIYIPELITIDSEISELESLYSKINMNSSELSEINSMTIIKAPFAFNQSKSKKLIVIIGFILGFIFSLFIVFIRNVIKDSE